MRATVFGSHIFRTLVLVFGDFNTNEVLWLASTEGKMNITSRLFSFSKAFLDCNCQAEMGQFEQRKFPRLYPIAVKK